MVQLAHCSFMTLQGIHIFFYFHVSFLFMLNCKALFSVPCLVHHYSQRHCRIARYGVIFIRPFSAGFSCDVF